VPPGRWCATTKERSRSAGDRSDPGVVSLVAELRGHQRQAAEEVEQWKTHHEERKTVDARLLYRWARVVTVGGGFFPVARPQNEPGRSADRKLTLPGFYNSQTRPWHSNALPARYRAGADGLESGGNFYPKPTPPGREPTMVMHSPSFD
jgi:hypothetical protein